MRSRGIETTQCWDWIKLDTFSHLDCDRPWLVYPLLVNRFGAEFGLAIVSANVISLFTRAVSFLKHNTWRRDQISRSRGIRHPPTTHAQSGSSVVWRSSDTTTQDWLFHYQREIYLPDVRQTGRAFVVLSCVKKAITYNGVNRRVLRFHEMWHRPAFLW